MLWKRLLSFAPLVAPVIAAVATPMIDPARQWVADHPTETIITGAIGAIVNWLAPSPIQKGGVVKKTHNATSLR